MANDNLKHLFAYDTDPYFQGKDPIALLEKTAHLMGESIQPLVDRSTYEKHGEIRSALYYDPEKDKGKSQHCYSQRITVEKSNPARDDHFQ